MSKVNINPLLRSDSYKASHFLQYPPEASSMFSYIEARQNNTCLPIQRSTFFGLQGFIKENLSDPIKIEHIEEAKAICNIHGVPFAEAAWKKVVTKYGGYAPISINAVKEGSQVEFSNALVSVECTDPDLFWVGSFYETELLRAVWYGTTVATISRYCKGIISRYLQATCDNPQDELPYKMHDFGCRGNSSGESAAIAGTSHLISFKGTDTLPALQWAHELYSAPYETLGFSLPAAEHSTICSWGRKGESDAYQNMVHQFGNGAFAVVSDSYDIFNAVKNIWGGELKDLVESIPGTLIIRPDSGDPIKVVSTIIGILADKFGVTINSKGFKVLKKVRVIQGDGINPEMIEKLYAKLQLEGFSAENLAVGMGGGLHQAWTRDSLSFAMKCSAIKIGEKWEDVYKDPVSGGKTSKRGRLSLINVDGKYQTVRQENSMGRTNLLEPVYMSGRLLRDQIFDEVRRLAA